MAVCSQTVTCSFLSQDCAIRQWRWRPWYKKWEQEETGDEEVKKKRIIRGAAEEWGKGVEIEGEQN
jgi:hypothetical protein